MDEVSFQYNDKYDSNYQKAYDFIVKNQKDPELVLLYSVHTDSLLYVRDGRECNSF